MSSRRQEVRRQAVRNAKRNEQFLRTLEFHIAALTPEGKAELAANILAQLAVELDDLGRAEAGHATQLVLSAQVLQQSLSPHAITAAAAGEQSRVVEPPAAGAAPSARPAAANFAP